MLMVCGEVAGRKGEARAVVSSTRPFSVWNLLVVALVGEYKVSICTLDRRESPKGDI